MAEGYDWGKKSKYWNLILYPESMQNPNLGDCADELGVDFAYCLHDKDEDGHKGDRKAHYHVLFATSNDGTTTAKHVYDIFNKLSTPGKKCALRPEIPGSVKHSYAYLIHDTENARKKGKYQYSPEERISCNQFDIARYETIDKLEKDRMCKELVDFEYTWRFENLAAYYEAFERSEQFKEQHIEYFNQLKLLNAFIDRICRGYAMEAKRKRQEAKPPKCSWCGSTAVVGKIETRDGYLWYCECDRATAYTVLAEIEESIERESIEGNV